MNKIFLVSIMLLSVQLASAEQFVQCKYGTDERRPSSKAFINLYAFDENKEPSLEKTIYFNDYKVRDLVQQECTRQSSAWIKSLCKSTNRGDEYECVYNTVTHAQSIDGGFFGNQYSNFVEYIVAKTGKNLTVLAYSSEKKNHNNKIFECKKVDLPVSVGWGYGTFTGHITEMDKAVSIFGLGQDGLWNKLTDVTFGGLEADQKRERALENCNQMTFEWMVDDSCISSALQTQVSRYGGTGNYYCAKNKITGEQISTNYRSNTYENQMAEVADRIKDTIESEYN